MHLFLPGYPFIRWWRYPLTRFKYHKLVNRAIFTCYAHALIVTYAVECAIANFWRCATGRGRLVNQSKWLTRRLCARRRRDTGFAEKERESWLWERSLPSRLPASKPRDPFDWTLRRYPVPPRLRYFGKVSVKVLVHVTLPTGYTASYGKW